LGLEKDAVEGLAKAHGKAANEAKKRGGLPPGISMPVIGDTMGMFISNAAAGAADLNRILAKIANASSLWLSDAAGQELAAFLFKNVDILTPEAFAALQRLAQLQGLSIEPFAAGGIVTQPTMAMIGEAGPEAVIPLNEMGSMGGITINFTQPVFFDREDTMNKFVDMISKGIDRKQRLRFGGAYNG